MWENFKELYKYRELINTITLREIKIRYKQAFLGIVWALIQPVFLMIIFTVVFSRFSHIPSEGIPYHLFSYAGLLPWTFFATALAFAIPSLVSNTNLITKVYLPREIFPIASVFAAFFDFLIATLLFFVVLFFYHVPLTINIFFVIILVIIQTVFTIGISFILSAINVFYRDVRYALPLLIQLWMFASPIIYPVSVVPEKWRLLYMLNPMAAIIDGWRKVIFQGILPETNFLMLSSLVSLAFFLFGYWYFKKVEIWFADMI